MVHPVHREQQRTQVRDFDAVKASTWITRCHINWNLKQRVYRARLTECAVGGTDVAELAVAGVTLGATRDRLVNIRYRSETLAPTDRLQH